jgi:hypothetical protein
MQFILPEKVTSVFNVLDSKYGVESDTRGIGTVSITASSSSLSANSADFLPMDIGKAVFIPGAGVSGAGLLTTIAGFADSSHVTVTTAASTTVTDRPGAFIATDCAPGIRQAFHDANAANVAGVNGAVGFFSMPEVFIPSGRYLIGSSLGSVGAFLIRGQDTILYDPTDTVSFIALPYTHHLNSITFEGGDRAITIANNNVGEDVFIQKCMFQNQVTYAIGSDASSQSTGIRIEGCLFFDNVTTGTVLDFRSGDDINVDGCTMVSSRLYCITLAGCQLTTRNMFAVPNNPGGAWALCTTGSFLAYRFRFGGEVGGKIFCEWRSPPWLITGTGSAYVPTRLAIVDCETYSTTFALKLYNLPGMVTCRGNAGDNFLLHYDASIPPNVRQTMQRLFFSDIRGNFGDWQPSLTSDQQVATMMTAVPRAEEFEHGNYITPADRALFIPALASNGSYSTAWGENGQPTNLKSSTVTDLFGETIPSYSAFDPTLLMNYGLTYYTALDGLAPGPYTYVIDLEVPNGHAFIATLAAGMTRNWYLRQGRHILNMHVWHSYSNLTTPAWQSSHLYSVGNIVIVSNTYGPTAAWRCVTAGTSGANMISFANGFSNAQVSDGTVVWEWIEDLSLGWDIQTAGGTTQLNIGAIRVFTGHVTARDWRTTVYASAIPMLGSWQIADKVINTNPVASGVEGWICTQAGGATTGAWQSSLAYSVGTCVTNGGTVFQCMQAGTSAGSGGPTGHAGTMNIVDGTAIWNGIANTVAVFKTLGSIGP